MIDERTVSDIYGKHGRELLIYICGFVRIKETAEDILHDSFVRLISYSRTYPLEETNIRAFLYKTARNLCIDYLRKTRRQQVSRLDDGADHAGSGTLAADIEYKDLKEKVDGLIEKKDPVSRSVYIMRTELSLSYEEIAQNLGISERTAKRKMKSMLEYLADSLEKYGFRLLLLILLALIAAKIVL